MTAVIRDPGANGKAVPRDSWTPARPLVGRGSGYFLIVPEQTVCPSSNEAAHPRCCEALAGIAELMSSPASSPSVAAAEIVLRYALTGR